MTNKLIDEKVTGLGRRDFLRKATIGTAAFAGLGMLNASNSAFGAIAATPDQRWDEEFDVIVVGSGTAIIGALTAGKAGAKTLVVEKNGFLGGTTMYAAQIYLPNNPLEKENGIDDSREKALTYLTECAKRWGGVYSDAAIAAYLDEGLKMYDMFINELGYLFTLDVHAPLDYFNIDGALPKGRGLGFKIDGQVARLAKGHPLVVKSCRALGVDLRTKTAGKRLVIDAAGNVVGLVIADDSGKETTIRAKKGVILGTGGFAHNPEMTAAFLRAPIYYSASIRTNTGDGHLMGMAVGANLANMQSLWGGPSALVNPDKTAYETDWGLYRGKPGAIIVNKHGERFGNEAAVYAIFNRAFDQWDTGTDTFRNIPAYFICDSSFTERYPLAGTDGKVGTVPPGAVKADTSDELAEKLGINAEGLRNTLRIFNENARQGIDPVWSRGTSVYDLSALAGDLERTDLKNPTLAPVAKAPFYGIAMYPGSIGTNGGLLTNEKAQVLNTHGAPIKGLYAVGNTSSSVFGGAYPGGGATVGSGFVMSYIAAKDALGV